MAPVVTRVSPAQRKYVHLSVGLGRRKCATTWGAAKTSFLSKFSGLGWGLPQGLRGRAHPSGGRRPAAGTPSCFAGGGGRRTVASDGGVCTAPVSWPRARPPYQRPAWSGKRSRGVRGRSNRFKPRPRKPSSRIKIISHLDAGLCEHSALKGFRRLQPVRRPL